MAVVTSQTLKLLVVVLNPLLLSLSPVSGGWLGGEGFWLVYAGSSLCLQLLSQVLSDGVAGWKSDSRADHSTTQIT